jgi:hypothetical protein
VTAAGHRPGFEQEARLERDEAERAAGAIPEADHVTYCARLRGPLDVGALADAVAAVGERHEGPRLRLLGDAAGGWRLRDGARAPTLEVERAGAAADDGLAAVARAEAQRRFGRDEALGRWRLWRRGTEDHVLLFAAEHLVADAWALDVLLRDLHAEYAARQAVDAGPAPAPPEAEAAPRATAFAEWQRERFGAGEGAPAIAPPRLDLSFARAGDAAGWRRSARFHRARVPPARLRHLQRAASRVGATPFMALAAAWQAALHAASGQRSIALAAPVANREDPRWERCVGWLAHYAVVESTLGPDLSAHRLLAHVRDRAEEAYADRALPYALAARLALGARWRPLDYHPDVVLNYLPESVHSAGTRFAPAGLTVEPVDVAPVTPHTALSLFAVEARGGLDLALRSDAAQFAEGDAGRLLDLFVEAIRWIALAPERSLGSELALDPRRRPTAPVLGPRPVVTTDR